VLLPVLNSEQVNSKLQEIFSQAYREVRPRAPFPEFQIEFFPFSSINNTIRLREGKIFVRISDLLSGAPSDVLHAIAHILLAKLYRKEIEARHATRYRRYLGRRDVSRKAHLVRQQRGRKVLISAEGRYYNLETIFDELNQRFFHGLLARPLMTWSRHSSRQSLGHYDPAHNTIVISRVFDRANIPRYAVEYLVYHEMLHLKHPVKLNGSRRCVHPKAFQQEERLFPELEKAKQLLKIL
jgi:predicted metal-dependent hydrolase